MMDPFAEAVALHRQGRLDEAAEAYGSILHAQPAHFEAAYHLSVLRAAQGRMDEALAAAREAARLEPGSWRGHAQVGALLAATHRAEESLEPLRRAAALEPGRAEVVNNLGAALRSLGRLDEAREQFERALELRPGYEGAMRNLAGVLFSLGEAAWKSERAVEAEGSFRRATELDAGHAGAWGQLGNVLAEEGRVAEAAEAFRRAIRSAPHRAEFYRYLIEAKPSELTAEDATSLEELARADLSDTERVDVSFALGKLFAARGEPQRSFEHLLAANAKARALRTYDEPAMQQSFERIAGVFDASFLAAHAGSGDPSQVPVFIVGMPRSGTTLVEQVLASHPAVYAGGERSLFEDVAKAVLAGGQPIAPAAMLAAGSAAFREIGEHYVRALRALAPHPAERITDKMPTNFLYAGLIRLALPNARTIHVRRDSVDTCWSCFSTYFAGEELAWTYDLGELGRYYRGYARLMDHWRAVLPPGAMLDVQYEELVEDFEAQARRIVAYCGLEWDDRCREFHKTQRPVKTASAFQVRRPIYKTSVNRAAAYGDLLKPLLDALSS
jgi:tetratricopeptide (TPR) repeat protein